MKKAIFPTGVPKPVGPYSPGVVASGSLLFVAGQGPLDPAVGKITATNLQKRKGHRGRCRCADV